MEINIKEKKYPIHFGTAALRLFCKEKKISIDEMFKWLKSIDMKKMDFDKFDDIVLLIFSGIKDGLRREGRKNDFDLELDDFYDYLDDGGDLEAVFSELQESMPEGNESGNQKPARAEAKK